MNEDRDSLDHQTRELVEEAFIRARNLAQSEPDLRGSQKNIEPIIRRQLAADAARGERDLIKLANAAVSAVRQYEQIQRSARSVAARGPLPRAS